VCFLGSEGVAVRGWLGYRVAECLHGGPAPRRHGVGGVHPVVHPEDSVACDVRPTQLAATVPDTARALVRTAPYPMRRNQHYDVTVSLKMQLLFLWYFTF
jgi:hypothetical protein